MKISRAIIVAGLVLVSFVLGGYLISAGGASAPDSPSATQVVACDIETIFDDSGDLASDVDLIQSAHAAGEALNVAQVDSLKSDAAGLVEQYNVVEPDPGHETSSKTLGQALEQYSRGLTELAGGLENRDENAQLEGIQHLERADLLRKSALDQLLDEGSCD